MTTREYTIRSSIRPTHWRLTIDEGDQNADDVIVTVHGGGGINVKAAELAKALKALGKLPESEAEEKLRKIEDAFEMQTSAQPVLARIHQILHPKPPFTPPERLGAVVEATGGDETNQFVRVGPTTWYRVGNGLLHEKGMLQNYRDHKVVSE